MRTGEIKSRGVILGIIRNAIEFGAFESNGVNSRTSDDGKQNGSEKTVVMIAKQDLPQERLGVEARPQARRFVISMPGARAEFSSGKGLSQNEWLSQTEWLSQIRLKSPSRAASFWTKTFGLTSPRLALSAASDRAIWFDGARVASANEPRVMRKAGKRGEVPSLPREVTTRCSR